MTRARVQFGVLVGIVAGCALGFATVSSAAEITEPAAATVQVANGPDGKPVPFTVRATGFPPERAVYVHQCDGTTPADDPEWTPARHCDPATAGASAIVVADGVALFSVDDPNRYFRVFHGASPQSQFNCIAPGETPPANGLRSFTNCQLRVATDMLKPTSDQVFRRLAFSVVGSPPGESPPTTAAPTTSASGSDSDSSSAGLALAGVGVAALVVVGVVVLVRRRRATNTR